MTTIGKIGAYRRNSEEWPQYLERLEFFFVANEITDPVKKRAAFMAIVGPETVNTLRSAIAPSKPAEKTYNELTKVLSDYFSPKQSQIVCRTKFYRCTRKQGQSIASYLAELRALADGCSFGATLDTMLRDRLVCGINDSNFQKRLLSEGDKLTLADALAIAQALESAVQDSEVLATSPQVQPATVAAAAPVHGIQQKKPLITKTSCYRCGKTGHSPATCKFRNETCYRCRKVGHIKPACRSRPSQRHSDKSVKTVSNQETGTSEEYMLLSLSSSSSEPIIIPVKVNGQLLNMELDTGAAVSLISEETYRCHWADRPLQNSDTKLKTYSGEEIVVQGTLQVDIVCNEQHANASLLVVEGNGPNLFGRDLLHKIKLNWEAINSIKSSELYEPLLEKYKALFEDKLGTLQNFYAKLYIDPNVTPKFCKPRPLPYAFRNKVEEELNHLRELGIIEPVQFAEWAAPIVPVLKSDNKSIRICGDFKLTVNKASKLDRYPIPKIDDILASLRGGAVFTKLDMSQAYQQLLLDEDSKQYVVINTHKGLFRYNRLPFGISSAPAIFQRVMENLLQDIPNVTVYFDDILVAGSSVSEHLSVLEQVLSRLLESGLRLKKEKCHFLVKSVTYLGYQIDATGIHPTSEKIRAIKDAPTPRNVTELKSYIGLLSYYSRFMPHLPTVLSPLYRLLHNDVPWCWSDETETSFQKSKQLLTSNDVLVHFNPELELILACDASPYGIGAVLAHRMPDSSERPIAFASRTLSTAEKKYSQMEKEALACVFGVKKFHCYIYGRHFSLISDHKPLLSLFNGNRPIPVQASARIQRWALTLASYEYDLHHRSSQDNANADGVSRLPLPETPTQVPTPPEVILLVEHLSHGPVTNYHIRHWTKTDCILSKVLLYLQKGWPDVCPSDDIKPYWTKQNELSLQDNCILWGNRVVVPLQGRQQLLHELHEGHFGIAKAKMRARSCIWWPNIDTDIERTVKECHHCQQSKPQAPDIPLHPWPWPSKPWSRLHLDFAGPIKGVMILVVIDAHSKWIEAYPMSTATSQATIQQLQLLFAQFGLPDTVVTDNGSSFVSQEFEDFLKRNGIHHYTSAPYHPATNGQAERAVQIIKNGLKRVTQGTMSKRLSTILFTYRVSPHATTNLSPAELMFGRNLKTRLDLIKPDIARHVEHKQYQQKRNHDSNLRDRIFSEGEKVYIRNFNYHGPNWEPAVIEDKIGPTSYIVKLKNGTVLRRHVQHIKKRFGEDLTDIQQDLDFSYPNYIPTSGGTERVGTSSQSNISNQGSRYPTRSRRPPDRFGSPLTY